MAKRIKLGQEVQDKVSGFYGIATTRTEFLQGCFRVEVQPHVDKEGKMQELQCFDEPQLEVIGEGITKAEEEIPGGLHHGHNPARPVVKSGR